MKDEPRPVPVHQHEHSEPAVFHQADVDDSTALARWLRRGFEKGPAFWALVAGAVLAVVALATMASGLAASRSTDPQAWVDLMTARTAEESLKVAEAHPDTPLALSARVQAANREYDQGFEALSNPAQRDLAGPRFKKALDLYKEVASAAADKKSPQAPIAAYGIARTLEARNELPKAIEQYRYVASTYPGTPEAKRSEVLAKALEDPANVAFYKELYAYKPPASATAPGEVPPPLIPGMNPGLPSALDPTKSFLPNLKEAGPADIDPPPVTPTPAPAPASTPAPAGAETKGAAPLPELPANPIEAPPK